MKQVYFPQITILKALAIISVILIHSLPTDQYSRYYTDFYIRQAVPIFIIIMGFNACTSFKKRGYKKLSELYSASYFKGKFKRILIPFLLVFLICYVLVVFKPALSKIGLQTLVGYLPLYGPGDYFVTILFQFTLIAPFIFWLYNKYPKVTIIACFTANIVFELAAPHSLILNRFGLYGGSIFRYLSAAALGFWIADNYKLSSRRNLFLSFGIPVSTLYIIGSYLFPDKTYYFTPAWGSQNVFSYFYPLMLVLLGMKFIPSNGRKFYALLGDIGKASYHIMLVQILYFGLNQSIQYNRGHYPFFIPLVNVAICTVLGLIFFRVEQLLLNPKSTSRVDAKNAS